MKSENLQGRRPHAARDSKGGGKRPPHRRPFHNTEHTSVCAGYREKQKPRARRALHTSARRPRPGAVRAWPERVSQPSAADVPRGAGLGNDRPKLWMRSPAIVLSAGDRTPTPKGHYTTDCICMKLQKTQSKAQ